MTKEDWKSVENALSLFNSVILNCDGYRLEIYEARNGNRIVLGWYVNGHFKGRWLLEDCEERRRFARPCERFVRSKKDRDEMTRFIKWLGKRRAKECGVSLHPESRYTFFDYTWLSFRSFKQHLKKNNKSINIISLEGGGHASDF